MKLKLFILMLFCFTVSVWAQNRKIIKVGIIQSNIFHKEAVSNRNVVLGLGYEHMFSKCFGLSGEIQYLTKSSILKNKAIGSWENRPPQGYYYDIDISLKYIDIPILVTMVKPINKNVNLRLHAGPSLAIAIKEQTKYNKLKKCLSDDPGGCQLDYIWAEGDGCFFLDNSGLGANIGLSLDWNIVEISFRYSHDVHDIDCIRRIYPQKKINSFLIFVAMIF
jgi:hypothetical protein